MSAFISSKKREASSIPVPNLSFIIDIEDVFVTWIIRTHTHTHTQKEDPHPEKKGLCYVMTLLMGPLRTTHTCSSSHKWRHSSGNKVPFFVSPSSSSASTYFPHKMWHSLVHVVVVYVQFHSSSSRREGRGERGKKQVEVVTYWSRQQIKPKWSRLQSNAGMIKKRKEIPAGWRWGREISITK